MQTQSNRILNRYLSPSFYYIVNQNHYETPRTARRSVFSKLKSFFEVTLRIHKNYSYIRINYLTVIAVVFAFSLSTNPFSLLLPGSLIFLYSSSPLISLSLSSTICSATVKHLVS